MKNVAFHFCWHTIIRSGGLLHLNLFCYWHITNEHQNLLNQGRDLVISMMLKEKQTDLVCKHVLALKPYRSDFMSDLCCNVILVVLNWGRIYILGTCLLAEQVHGFCWVDLLGCKGTWMRCEGALQHPSHHFTCPFVCLQAHVPWLIKALETLKQ